MGKRGPAPKPTALRLIDGDQKSRINRAEPSAPARKPVMPPHMRPEAKKVWRYYAPDMVARGILTVFDRDTFAVFCEAVAEHRRAYELLKGPLIIRGSNSDVKKNPAFQLWRDTAGVIRSFAQEFGLSASARSQLTTPDVQDDLHALLYGGDSRGAR